jgi:hypothetical protein
MRLSLRLEYYRRSDYCLFMSHHYYVFLPDGRWAKYKPQPHPLSSSASTSSSSSLVLQSDSTSDLLYCWRFSKSIYRKLIVRLLLWGIGTLLRPLTSQDYLIQRSVDKSIFNFRLTAIMTHCVDKS